jgi:hypothetical protein
LVGGVLVGRAKSWVVEWQVTNPSMVYGLVIITPWWQNSGIDSPHLGCPFLADFRLTECNMTALDYGWRLTDTRIGLQRSPRIGAVKFSETQTSVREGSSDAWMSGGHRYF